MKHSLAIIFSLFVFSGKLLYAGNDSGAKIKTVASITPIKYLLDRIGGDELEISVLVPPEADPHIYELTPNELKVVSKAELFVKMGSGVEFELIWGDRIGAINNRMHVIDCSENVTIRDGDPHIWVSVKNSKIISENICRELSIFDPGSKSIYEKNLNKLIRTLDEMDREFSEKFIGLENNKFIVLHPAWGYFADDYGLEQFAIEHEGKEPLPGDLARVIETAKKHSIKKVYASPYRTLRIAQSVAAAIGGRVIKADPLSESYLGSLRQITEDIAGRNE